MKRMNTISKREHASLSEILGVSLGDIVTLTGAGGKTSCLFKLGEELGSNTILLTTTTKMKYPLKDQVDFIHSQDEMEKKPNMQKKGRTFLYGNLLPQGKCGAVSYEKIKEISAGFDVTIIEADGSRGLSLKGYSEHEPCIPEYATMNVGILTTYSLGKPADPSFILRYDEFLNMTKLKAGEIIREEHLAKWISHPAGMFKGSFGRRILFWNQIENEEQKRRTEAVSRCLDADFRYGLSRVVTGSIKKEQYQVNWYREDGDE